VPAYDRIVLRRATTLQGLASAAETTIWTRHSTGEMANHIWAPEIHFINNRWYIYFAAGHSSDQWRIRMYVLENASANPLSGTWTERGRIVTSWDSFSLDATTFVHNGIRYLVWAQSEPGINANSSLYIARMGANPWQITGSQVRISTPTLSWETIGFRVNEGAAVIVRNGRVFMTYSASATDANYCMGLLTASANSDLLARSSWTKSPDPIFVSNEQTQRYGPGHNSFTVTGDGTDVLVYHARDYKQITGDPLYDPNRHTRVQKLYWHEDGTPLFGIPVGSGGPIVRLSPADRPRSFVKHVGDAFQVAHAPRELELTQFRFVKAADGTETVQSVDQPAKFLVVSGTTVSLGATGTPVTRIAARGGGVNIRVAPGQFLHHRNGQLTVAAKATAFKLS
jgi:GH43 family beta-xylosidase